MGYYLVCHGLNLVFGVVLVIMREWYRTAHLKMLVESMMNAMRHVEKQRSNVI